MFSLSSVFWEVREMIRGTSRVPDSDPGTYLNISKWIYDRLLKWNLAKIKLLPLISVPTPNMGLP